MDELEKAAECLEDCASQLMNMGGMLNLDLARDATKCASRLRQLPEHKANVLGRETGMELIAHFQDAK